jgi:alpha-ketoglutarate-dependent taurine dioxygenase
MRIDTKEGFEMKTRPFFENLGLLVDGTDDPDLMRLDPDAVKDLFRSYGLVVFDKFKTDTEVFQTFTDQFGEYMTNKGGGSVREVINKDGDGTILSVSYNYQSATQKTFGLPLHSDRSYVKSWPPLMWFYCVVPAVSEGETTVCDGVQVWEQLSPSTQKLFREKRIKYIRHYGEKEWKLWAQTDNLADVEEYCQENGLSLAVDPTDRSVTTAYTTSAVVRTRWSEREAFVNSILIVEWQEDELKRTMSVVRFEDGSRIPPDVIAEVRQVTKRLARGIPWKPGQIAMLNNLRHMHGRNAFQDPKREIYVRMCEEIDW